MKNIFSRFTPKSQRSKSNIAIILTAAILIEATSAIQYFYAKEGIRKEVEQRAEGELQAKSLEIRNVKNIVEVAVANTVWAVEQRLSEPDSLEAVTRMMLASNEYIVGSTVAFKPYYYKSKGRQFAPYSYKSDGKTTSKQLGTKDYDYHSMEWYTKPMQTGSGYWSEPYYDKGGGEMMMATYSKPIHNPAGNIVAVLTADVSLDWLSQVINAHHIYPGSYNVLLSREGQIMACPVETLIMSNSLEHVSSKMEDSTISHINRKMLAGENGQATVRDDKGEKKYVFYDQMDDDTGWSMAVVCTDSEIFHGLRHVTFMLGLLMLAGMGLLGFIIWHSARSARRLEQINSEKKRIQNELSVARAIQMSMLPKSFPPYPDCDSITIYGQQTPAKAVGGDLYDFYIRGNKLFFCIGDVSGKGVPASLVMAVTKSLFRTISAHVSEPDNIVSQLSDSIADDNDMNMFVTLFVGVIDMCTGNMRYCNAGHDAPLLISEDGKHLGLLPVDSNIPAGVMRDWHFTRQETLIDNGTTIFLYTDGLTEAENFEHKQFGEQRLHDTAKAACIDGKPSPVTIIEQMTEAVHKFVGEAEQSDDLTMMAVQYTPQKDCANIQRQHTITLPNDIEKVPQLHEFISSIAEEAGLDMSESMGVDLAVEETVVNVMNYAYPKGTKGVVNIVATTNEKYLTITISDNGKPFDPTKQSDIDTTLSAEERPIGGLGIYLVRQIMDDISYERKDGRNILSLRKVLGHKVEEQAPEA